MRELTTHIVPGDAANHQIRIAVLDEPGAGGANHCYAVRWHPKPDPAIQLVIEFQNGPIAEFGVNGVTQEALLAIVIDRLSAFQAGPYACVENHAALHHCLKALDCLQQRTRARMARGVEGTHQA